jgi:thioredoxin 1
MKGNFNSIIQSSVPVLIDFSAEWCGPCKMQSPIIAEVARELSGKVKVIKIDVDRNNEIAGRYQVRSVPTLALFREGKNLWRQSGLMDKNTIINVIQQYL